MKRIVALLVVLGVSGLVIGCGGNPPPAPKAPAADMGRAASTGTPPAHKPEEKPEAKPDEDMKEPGDGETPAEPAAPADPEKKPETETEEKPE